jgi:hypothetical protein
MNPGWEAKEVLSKAFGARRRKDGRLKTGGILALR